MSDDDDFGDGPEIVGRTFLFGNRVIMLFRHLYTIEPALVSIYDQLLRAGTAVGALVEEAQSAESDKDFVHKLAVGLKEAKESHYWLRQLRKAEVLKRAQLNPLVQEALEIKLVLGAIIASKKGKRKGQQHDQKPEQDEGPAEEETEEPPAPDDKLF
ncbi:MAG: four helix bundle protein [Planctomycetes bacterium]|nr:four helix bundle protein [Planctomycetota bacterium]MCB9934682.1 four helix bundle protein [Planctomycetota bacterium]